MCMFFVCEVADDVCYQASFRKNLFVTTNKGKVAHIRPRKPRLGGIVGALKGTVMFFHKHAMFSV